MRLSRYDIDGNEITIVKCTECGHEVDITQLRNITVNGMEHSSGLGLIIPDAYAGCCERPNYSHIH